MNKEQSKVKCIAFSCVLTHHNSKRIQKYGRHSDHSIHVDAENAMIRGTTGSKAILERKVHILNEVEEMPILSCSLHGSICPVSHEDDFKMQQSIALGDVVRATVKILVKSSDGQMCRPKDRTVASHRKRIKLSKVRFA